MSVTESPRLEPSPDDVPPAAADRSVSPPMTIPLQVTIGIPVYNGEKYLAETLESVLRQTHTNLEIVCCDNASTDGTAAILARYAEADPRIRVLTNDVNVGAAGNYNLALHQATSDYFAWLSADDILEPTFIERNLGVLIATPDAVGAYAEAIRIDQHGSERGDYREAMAGMRLGAASAGTRFSSAVLGFPAIVLFGVYRRQAMLDTPGHGAFIGGDRVFVSEMALKGPIMACGELLFRRRVHPEAYSAIMDKKVKARWFAGDEARAGIPDINRLKQHYAALRRSAPDTRSRLRGIVTLFVGLPVVLAKSHAFGGVERVLGLFGRSIDHTRYAS